MRVGTLSHSNIANRGCTPTPALPRKRERERERGFAAIGYFD
jgi:hypothetical protein